MDNGFFIAVKLFGGKDTTLGLPVARNLSKIKWKILPIMFRPDFN